MASSEERAVSTPQDAAPAVTPPPHMPTIDEDRTLPPPGEAVASKPLTAAPPVAAPQPPAPALQPPAPALQLPAPAPPQPAVLSAKPSASTLAPTVHSGAPQSGVSTKSSAATLVPPGTAATAAAGAWTGRSAAAAAGSGPGTGPGAAGTAAGLFPGYGGPGGGGAGAAAAARPMGMMGPPGVKGAAATAATAGAALPAGGVPGAAVAGQAGKTENPFGLKPETKTAFKDFLRIFSYSTWLDRLMIGAAVAASIAAGVTMPLMNIVFGRVFASFTGYYSQAGPDQSQEAFRLLINECVLYLIYIFVARFTLSYIAFLGFRMSSLRISAAIRLEYMRSLFSQRVSLLDALPAGRTAAVITIMASTLQQGISEKLSIFLQSVSLVLAALAISFSYSWQLTLVTGSGMVLILIVYAVTTPALVRIMGQVQQCEIGASTVANEVFTSVRMVAACGAEAKMARRYDGWVDEGSRKGMRMRPIVAFQQAPVFFSIYATFALCFWYSLKMFRAGEITSPEVLIVVLLSVMMMIGVIGTLTTPIAAAARSASAATIFYKVIDAPKQKTSGLKGPDVSAAEDIVLERINFAYPTRPLQKILDGLTVKFPAGKMTAIVGPSGSGKSTIVALLERWYEMDGDPVTNIGVLWLRNGILQVGGRPLKEIDMYWWRAQIGLVQQEPFLFNDSIYKNVAYGLTGTEWENAPDDVKSKLVAEACQEAFAEEFIQRLPEGYNTFVGDAGIKLSGGQRQRLAIARAIVRKPKILILDEATSAIDVRGEQMVQAALEKVSKDRTTIMIAHRLSTIKKADNIVVMRKGKVVEQGTHESLMALGAGGVYHALATAQQLIAGTAAAVGGDDEASTSLGSSYDYSEKKSIDVVLTEDSYRGDVDADTNASLAAEGGGKKKKKKGKRGLFGSFIMLLREQLRHWPWYLVLLLGALGGGAAAPLQAYLFANLVSLFQLWGDADLLQRLMNFWCLMFVVLAAGVGIAYFALAWSATTLSFYIVHHYRKEYIRNILSKRISFFDAEDNSTGSLTARLATDPTQLQQLLGMNMGFVLISVLNVVGCLAISFYFGWKLTAVTVVTTLPVILGAAFFRVRHEKRLEKMGAAVFAESARFATESVGAFRTVASLTLERAICDRYATLLRDHVRASFARSSGSTVLFALSDSISLLCMAFVLWYGGKLMADHEYYPFQYVIVYIAVLQGGIGAGQWLSFAPNIAQATVAANRIVDLRSKDDDDGRLISLDHGDIGDDDMGVKIEFKNVWFRYPTRDVPVLSGLNLAIEKGQFAAVVGPSGSGKTTIISLLERFYRLNSGRITYNGLEISDLGLRNYRKEISLVAQEPCLFDGTIRENILLGMDQEDGGDRSHKDGHSENSNSSISGTDKEKEKEKGKTSLDAALVQACRDAEIHDFISSLPEGYDTAVGTKGLALSGGQKQRIAIARALVRNPRLLLLDEATSSLDSETERAVQAVFERTKQSRTMVVVAHRLATVQNADVIFVMGDGKVLERGNHAELIGRRGVYYQMCQSQALDR